MVTDDKGEVVFNLRKGKYPVKVTKKDYVAANSTIVIDNAAITPEITLVKE